MSSGADEPRSADEPPPAGQEAGEIVLAPGGDEASRTRNVRSSEPHPLSQAPENRRLATLAEKLTARAGLVWEPPVPWGRYGGHSFQGKRSGGEVFRIRGVARGICVWRRGAGRRAHLEGVAIDSAVPLEATLIALLHAVSQSLSLRGVEEVCLEPGSSLDNRLAESALQEAGFYAKPGQPIYERVQSRDWRLGVAEPAVRAAWWLIFLPFLFLGGMPLGRWVLWALTPVALSFAAGVLEGWAERRATSPWVPALLGPPVLTALALFLLLQADFSLLVLAGTPAQIAADTCLEALPKRLFGAAALGLGFGLAATGQRTLGILPAIGASFLIYTCGILAADHFLRVVAGVEVGVACLPSLGALPILVYDSIASSLASSRFRTVKVKVAARPAELT